jgi:cytidine deaminase
MRISGFHHIQLAMPEGGEAEAAAFYAGVLGLRQVAKPEALQARGGAWFELGAARLHLGVQTPFSPATKAHPALEVTSLAETIAHLGHHGIPHTSDIDLPGMIRVYIADPFGNRIELVETTQPEETLLAAARAVLNPRRLSKTVEVGGVGCALRTASGAIHTGICIDAASGIGFCAEHAAVASMITAGESRIMEIVAVDWDGTILQPCGRCRELVVQVDPGNAETRVTLPGGTMPMRALLPDHWLLDR